MNLTMRPVPGWVRNGLVVVAIVAMFAVDVAIGPDFEAPVLYILPIALAALAWRPRAVLLVVAAILLLVFMDSLRVHLTPTDLWVHFYAVTAVAFIAILLGLEREAARRETRHRQELIHAVERLRQPLTVILAYSQVLCEERPAPSLALKRAPEAIDRAAHDLRRILCDILDTTTSSGS